MTRNVYTIAVIFLGTALVACIGGIVALSLAEPQRAIPDVLQNLSVGSMTGLVGLLVRPPAGTA